MINLAGHKEADTHVSKELFIMGADLLEGEPSGEVKTKYYGSILGGNIILRRAWYYWIAEGPVPLDAALAIHEKKWGDEVRVGGHCASPSPLEYGVTHIDSEGVTLRVDSELRHTSLERARSGDFGPGVYESLCATYESIRYFGSKEELDKNTAYSYVDLYHIDSQVGLKLFVDECTKQQDVISSIFF